MTPIPEIKEHILKLRKDLNNTDSDRVISLIEARINALLWVIQADDINEQGDVLEIIGDITLNLEYWDCECETDYIHPNSKNKCNVCEHEETDQPNSREDEVQEYIYNKRTFSIHLE